MEFIDADKKKEGVMTKQILFFPGAVLSIGLGLVVFQATGLPDAMKAPYDTVSFLVMALVYLSCYRIGFNSD